MAIWTLIEDQVSTAGLGPWNQCRVNEIVNDAMVNGYGFVPECGDYVAVILAPINGNQVIVAQIIFGEVEVSPCLVGYGGEETAWGDGTEFADDRGWATYIVFTPTCGG